MVAFGGSVDALYFKDDAGELQPFILKVEYAQFKGMTYQQAQARLHDINKQEHDLNWKRQAALVNYQVSIEQCVENGNNFYINAPQNTQKTIQPGIKDRNIVMREEEQKQRAQAYMEVLEGQTTSYSFSMTIDASADDDDLEDIF
jgi:hypothetical protein